jgi:hypothetical protein
LTLAYFVPARTDEKPPAVELTASIVLARRQEKSNESRVAIEFEVATKGVVLLVVESFATTEYSLRLRRSWVKGKGGRVRRGREGKGRAGPM